MIGSYVITTVTTAATTADLTTLATFKDDWNVSTGTSDAFIRRTISRCSAAAAQYCNRVFGIATYQDQFRPERAYRLGNLIGDNKFPLMLGSFPLVSVTSITEITSSTSTLLVVGTDYEIDYAKGYVYRLDSNGYPRDWPTCEIVVVYLAGYVLPGQSAVSGAASLPPEIEDAVGRMVYARFSERSRDPNIVEESVVGVGTIKYGSASQSEGAMSPDVTDILDNHRIILAG